MVNTTVEFLITDLKSMTGEEYKPDPSDTFCWNGKQKVKKIWFTALGLWFTLRKTLSKPSYTPSPATSIR